MIERHWKGTTRSENADSYIQHLLDDTFPQLYGIDGFKNATILKRNLGNDVEFLIITTWESMDAIKKFAGENTELAVVPLEVQKMMISYDLMVHHYIVAINATPPL